MIISNIRGQIEGYCDCLPDVEDDVIERSIEQMIMIISKWTCWTTDICETFLHSKRTEYIDIDSIDPCACECDNNIVRHIPYFELGIDQYSFNVTLIKRSGIEETVTPVQSSDFAYSSHFKDLKVDLSDYVECFCKCPPESTLAIQYYAGFDCLPDCLLPFVCDMLHVLFEKNNCDCSHCQTCKPSGTDPKIEPYGSNAKTIENYMSKLIKKSYPMLLSQISLCHNIPKFIGEVI